MRRRFEQVPLTTIPVLRGNQARQVLNVSDDRGLLQTRSAILQHAGIVVVNARGCAEAVRACRRYRFEAVVVCHGLLPEHKREVVRAVRRQHSGNKALVVGLYTLNRSEAAAADVAVDSHDGPDALLHALRSVM